MDRRKKRCMLWGNILLCGKAKMSRMRGKTYSNFEMGFNKTESEKYSDSCFPKCFVAFFKCTNAKQPFGKYLSHKPVWQTLLCENRLLKIYSCLKLSLELQINLKKYQESRILLKSLWVLYIQQIFSNLWI